jgi:hypothetical protein
MAPVRHSLLLRLRRLSVTNEVTVTHTERERALNHPNGQTIGLHNGASSHKHTFIHTRTCTSLSLSHIHIHTHTRTHTLTHSHVHTQGQWSVPFLPMSRTCPCRRISASTVKYLLHTHTGTDTHIGTDTDTHTHTQTERQPPDEILCTVTGTRTDRDAPVGGCNGPFLWVSALAEGQVLFI